MDPIRLHILSPEGEILDTTTDLVVLPGTQGLFEVLQDHAPLITSLEAGVITYRDGAERKAVAIRSGFVEVRDNRVDVCAEL